MSNFFVLFNKNINTKSKILYLTLFSIAGIISFFIFDPMPSRSGLYFDFLKSFLDQFNGNIVFLLFELLPFIFFTSLLFINILFLKKNFEKNYESLVLILTSFSAYIPSLIFQKIPSLNYFNELSLWIGIIFFANLLTAFRNKLSNPLLVGLIFFLIISVTYSQANYFIFSNTKEDINRYNNNKDLDYIKSQYQKINNKIKNLDKNLPVYLDSKSSFYKDLSFNKDKDYHSYFIRFQALTGMTQIFSVKKINTFNSNFIYYSNCKNVYYNFFFQYFSKSSNLKNFCLNINKNLNHNKSSENFMLYNLKKNETLKNLNKRQKRKFICKRINLDENNRYYLVNDTLENIQLKKCIN